MSAVHTGNRPAVGEIVLAVILLVGILVIWLGGGWTWLTTVLVASYPCGETYQAEPACALAHPEVVRVGHALVLGVPPVCLLLGTIACVRTVALGRRPLLPVAVLFLIAVAALAVGAHLVDAGLGHLTPRS